MLAKGETSTTLLPLRSISSAYLKLDRNEMSEMSLSLRSRLTSPAPARTLGASAVSLLPDKSKAQLSRLLNTSKSREVKSAFLRSRYLIGRSLKAPDSTTLNGLSRISIQESSDAPWNWSL